ncbi:hypothetical protein ID866_10271 [Astraeus odoratus]|nr:hypothetical protein ID866_10271 [Astraeus odoratus]
MEAEQNAWEEAEQLVRQEAEQKREEEEKAQRAEEARQRVEEAGKAAETWRRAVEKHWMKPTGGSMCKWRRMQTKEDDTEGDDNDFAVPAVLAEEHRDVLSALTTTLSALLKEFKGYHHEQWDLQACQVRGLKALKKEMRKAKELKSLTKGKEKAAELLEESLESSDEDEEEEEVAEGKGSNEEGAVEGKGSDGDGDIEMSAMPSESAA